MKQTSIAVFDAYSLRLVRRLLVGRTSLRIILSDVGERRNGQNAVGYPVISMKTSGYPRLKSEANLRQKWRHFRVIFVMEIVKISRKTVVFRKSGHFSKIWPKSVEIAGNGRFPGFITREKAHYQGKKDKNTQETDIWSRKWARDFRKKKSRQLPHNLGFHRSGFWAAEILTSGLSVGISPANPAISGL